jgi:hypothetical protein
MTRAHPAQTRILEIAMNASRLPLVAALSLVAALGATLAAMPAAAQIQPPVPHKAKAAPVARSLAPALVVVRPNVDKAATAAVAPRAVLVARPIVGARVAKAHATAAAQATPMAPAHLDLRGAKAPKPAARQ